MLLTAGERVVSLEMPRAAVGSSDAAQEAVCVAGTNRESARNVCHAHCSEYSNCSSANGNTECRKYLKAPT